MLSLDELIDDSEDGDYDEDDDSKDWVHLTNRGGLLRITDDAFSLFHAVEQVIRKDQAKQISGGIRGEIIHSILDDSNVRMMGNSIIFTTHDCGQVGHCQRIFICWCMVGAIQTKSGPKLSEKYYILKTDN